MLHAIMIYIIPHHVTMVTIICLITIPVTETAKTSSHSSHLHRRHIKAEDSATGFRYHTGFDPYDAFEIAATEDSKHKR